MVLSKIFSDAVEFEYLEKSPVKKRFHLPEVLPSKRPYMTYEQALIFLEYTMHEYNFGIACWIMTLAGPRISEIELLEWSDIDFEKDEIKINKSYSTWTKKERNHTKNKGIYTVPMCPMLRAFLWNRRKSEGKVCASLNGKMINRWGLARYLRKISERLRLPVRASHGLRHTCARIFVELGASDENISELLGHKCLASAKTYTHRDDLSHLKLISKKIS